MLNRGRKAVRGKKSLYWLFSRKSVHEKRNGRERSSKRLSREGTRKKESHISSPVPFASSYQTYSWFRSSYILRKPSEQESGVKMVGKRCFVSCLYISAVLGLPVSLFEWRIQTTATCWYGELFPLTQAHNVRASWPLAVIFAVCSCAAFWHRRREAMQQSAFIAASSLTSVRCVRAFKHPFFMCNQCAGWSSGHSRATPWTWGKPISGHNTSQGTCVSLAADDVLYIYKYNQYILMDSFWRKESSGFRGRKCRLPACCRHEVDIKKTTTN